MFEWDVQKAITNYEKHRISFEKAVTIFGDPDGLDGEDSDHSKHEQRRQRIALSMAGHILFVVYTVRRTDNEKKETIRIISARQASRKERTAYS